MTFAPVRRKLSYFGKPCLFPLTENGFLVFSPLGSSGTFVFATSILIINFQIRSSQCIIFSVRDEAVIAFLVQGKYNRDRNKERERNGKGKKGLGKHRAFQ